MAIEENIELKSIIEEFKNHLKNNTGALIKLSETIRLFRGGDKKENPTPINNPQPDKSYRLNICTKYSIALDVNKCYYVQCISSSIRGVTIGVTWDPREGNTHNPESEYDQYVPVGGETRGCVKNKSKVLLHAISTEGSTEGGVPVTATIRYLECDCP